MKRIPLVLMMVCFIVLQLNAQINNANATKEAPNFFIITTDGLRWQELFNGMQDDIVNQKKFHRGDSNYLFNPFFFQQTRKARNAIAVRNKKR